MQARWRCAARPQTLKELADEEGVTESRMCQVAGAIERDFVTQLPAAPALVWRVLRPCLDTMLEKRLPHLAGLFGQDLAAFCRMLERFSDQPKGTIGTRQLIPRRCTYRNVLETLASSHAAPIDRQFALEFIAAETGLRSLQCNRLLDEWERSRLIREEETGLWPGCLSARVLVEAELLKHPAGLRWPVLARKLNGEYPHLGLDETEKPSSTRVNDQIYLAAKGVYRNRCFQEVDKAAARALLDGAATFLSTRPGQRARLDEVREALPGAASLPYFEARDIVATRADEAGIHFDGRSGSDTLSLVPEAKRIDTEERVIRIFEENSEPLTRADVEKRLERGKGSALCASLDRLVEAGALTRISRRYFQQTSAVMSAAELERVRNEIRALVNSDPRPLEADLLRHALNPMLGLEHTKYFYQSICEAMAAKEGWEVTRSIVGRAPLDLRSIRDAIVTAYQPGFEVTQLAEATQSHLRVSKAMVTRAALGWLSERGTAAT